ncbi:MAG TPA: DUF3592 domain-containing protein [Myxococcaceae bacterium]
MAAIRPYLALIVAIILGAMAYTKAQPVLAFGKVAKPATAKVTGVHSCKERPPPDGSRSNFDGFAECADIAFRAISGREVQGAVRGWPGRSSKGEQIDVLYDPERPERHERDGVLDQWWQPGLFGLATALVLVRGTVGLGRQYSS